LAHLLLTAAGQFNLPLACMNIIFAPSFVEHVLKSSCNWRHMIEKETSPLSGRNEVCIQPHIIL
jgi:hypothetical protein